MFNSSYFILKTKYYVTYATSTAIFTTIITTPTVVDIVADHMERNIVLTMIMTTEAMLCKY